MNWTTKLSAVEQLFRACRLLPGVACYEEMQELIWRARRVGLVPRIVEKHGTIETPKWLVLNVIFENCNPYYWLVSVDKKDGKEEIFSFSSAASGSWSTCFVVDLVALPSVESIAHPDDVQKHIRNVGDLHYTTARATYKTSKRWTSILKSSSPQIYEALPLGKPYRAIDIGALVPVFRTKDRILGLVIK